MRLEHFILESTVWPSTRFSTGSRSNDSSLSLGWLSVLKRSRKAFWACQVHLFLGSMKQKPVWNSSTEQMCKTFWNEKSNWKFMLGFISKKVQTMTMITKKVIQYYSLSATKYKCWCSKERKEKFRILEKCFPLPYLFTTEIHKNL